MSTNTIGFVNTIADRLQLHQREPNSTASCTCGWYDLYPEPRDHSVHVAEEIAQAIERAGA